MVACPECDFSNLPEARFCSGCGAALGSAPAMREVRKTVTIVFCDVTGSTALGERLDPESLRQVMARYFEAMRGVIERHGGTVEKFIGDAVMAVFGVPVVHEDDALRAVRAASDMRSVLAEVNVTLERDYGTRLEARIGVNTGEVVTGTEERLATGDAVNVAARLEQVAAPGEILLGDETFRLVRSAVDAEALDPLDLEGKASGVAAYRLRAVKEEEARSRLDVPMVGRRRELRSLEDAWDRVVSERACVLFTLLGVAGVGKSRLIREFLGGVETTALRGRCLPYGEGITYWSVVEVVKQLQSLRPEVPGPIAGLLGEGDPATSPDEIAWAFRQLLEETAGDALLVVFEDIHWGEATFLDLIEHVAAMSRGAPILLLCVARPELLDRRPNWGGGMLNATTVLLQPLSAGETDELIDSLGVGLDPEMMQRIRTAAEGNPLFVEEMLALVAESGTGEVAVPPTVQALLAARLDQLGADERDVLERGSVEGQVFHRGGIEALGVAVAGLSPSLSGLVRKELVRPEPATLPGDDAYRFRHILIRDAAYDSLPKATRAELHEGFAGWLDDHVDLVERDEIVGYHLERAYNYRSELGPLDDEGRQLGRRAAERLLTGGRTANERGNVGAAASLLGRALDLLPQDADGRAELLPEVAAVLLEVGEFARAETLLEEATDEGDELLQARVRLQRRVLSTLTDTSSTTAYELEHVRELIAIFERVGAESDVADARLFMARLLQYAGRCGEAEREYEAALHVARRLADRRLEREVMSWWLAAKRFGPAPVDETLEFFDDLARDHPDDKSLLYAVQMMGAVPWAMRGAFDQARAMLPDAAPLGGGLAITSAYGPCQEGAMVETLAGDFRAAAATARIGWDGLGAIGETGFRSTIGSLLAQALVATGEEAEAAAILEEVGRMAQADDIDAQVRLGIVRAQLASGRGDHVEAQRVGREALEIIDATDYLDLGGDAHRTLGDVLAVAGDRSQARAEWQSALDRYEQKGNRVRSDQIRERLA